MMRHSPIALALLLAAAGAAEARGVASTFLYTLQDGTARRNAGWASLSWDENANELFVVSGANVAIFDDDGLPLFTFGEQDGFGKPLAAAALESGEIFVLTSGAGAGTWLVRCNFRGEPQARIDLTGLSAEFADGFNPASILARNSRLYLVDRNSMKVLVVSGAGEIVASQDLAQLLGLGSRDRGDAMMRGLAVDRAGNLYVTVASAFSVYVVTPDGKTRAFGSRGSSPGKFNVVSGIAVDDAGRVFVTDALRSVVMVFDASFKFLGEFGYRGGEPENLISPFEVAVGNGRVYVSQSRGPVKVFAVQFD